MPSNYVSVGVSLPPPPDLAADLEALRRERDFFKQQMEYFKQQLSSQAGRAAPVVPGLGMAMDSDRASARGPLTRVRMQQSMKGAAQGIDCGRWCVGIWSLIL